MAKFHVLGFKLVISSGQVLGVGSSRGHERGWRGVAAAADPGGGAAPGWG
jgi:hypothetical protein